MDIENKSNLSFEIDFEKGIVLLKKPFSVLDSVGNNIEFLNTFNEVIEIPVDNFINIINSASGESYKSPILPYGTVYFQLNNENYFSLVLESKEFKTFIDFNRHQYLKKYPIIFPSCYVIFFIPANCYPEFINFKLTKTVMIIKSSPLEELDFNKKYAQIPFPNHSFGYSTGICWGSSGAIYNWSKSVPNLQSLETAVSKYLVSQFNDDLLPRISFNIKKIFEIINSNSSDDYNEFISFIIEIHEAEINSDSFLYLSQDFISTRSINCLDIGTYELFLLFSAFYCKKYNSFPYWIVPLIFEKSSETLTRIISSPFEI